MSWVNTMFFVFYLGPSDFKVDTGGAKRISRGTIDFNEALLKPVIQHIGSRVGVDVLQIHIEALYAIMQIPVDRFCPKHLAFSGFGGEQEV